ncbi:MULTISPECIES: hypothetical protein [Mycobacterium]|uniref:Uncharacterized protein n=2 Tax=Mycobacterium TaxID=1763 RepID=A0AAW5SA76_MYCBC|nr:MULTISPECIES: hypothetical protein [Mycobacterium]EUA09604.1 hypothetical protein I553_3688 [Mycobacterium xenopi 4042]EUA17510.1 hypothetical protein I552_0711 [Mycobacterium xenopi 3993]MCV6991786.1 hypothetical protein [Mycobacterium bouchedurhonense]MCV6996710.1 hypothetical protein [Mycobacterium timonense]MDA3642253.1 hypothetical protein [Mycobacterium xenopi]
MVNDEAALNAYAQQILAGTELTVTDIGHPDNLDGGAAADALRHGWDMARRAGQVRHDS